MEKRELTLLEKQMSKQEEESIKANNYKKRYHYIKS